MEIINEQAENEQVGAPLIWCIAACGTLCLMSYGTATAIMVAAAAF